MQAFADIKEMAAEQFEFRPVHPQDRAVCPDPVKANGSILEEVLKFLFKGSGCAAIVSTGDEAAAYYFDRLLVRLIQPIGILVHSNCPSAFGGRPHEGMTAIHRK